MRYDNNYRMEPLLPSSTGKPMAWDVTVPDTYADSHIDKTAVRPGAAADKAGQTKIDKYVRVASIHLLPVCY